MASDGKVVFPVRFDLDSAVREATGDADRVLKRLGVMIASRPLKLGVEITPPKGGWDKKLGNIADGSINAMRKEMRKLVEEWNKLSEAQRITNQQTGVYTAEATKILNRYSQLVAASESYARGLEQIAAAARKSADAELKASRETAAKHEERRKILAAEETSISAVAAKMKVYRDVISQNDFGSKAYRYAAAQLERLGAQMMRLKEIMKSSTGNQGKGLFNAEKLKSTLKGSESTIEQVKAKLKAIDQILAKVPQDSFGFRKASEEGTRLLALLKDMESHTPTAQLKAQEQLQREWLAAKDQREREKQRETEQAVAAANRENQARQAAYNTQRQAGLERQRILKAEETSISAVTAKLQLQQQRLNDAKVGTSKYEKVRIEVEHLTKKLAEMQEQLTLAGRRAEALRALREILSASERTISGINGKLQVYQERLQGLEVGSQKFNKTAAEVRRLSEELQRANQYISDFQSKAFKGLSTNFTARQTEAVINLRNQIEAIDKRFNMLYQTGRATNADGSYTTRVNDMLRERAKLQSEISRMMKTAADAQIEREKEINRIQEQRKAKAQAIADKKKNETKAVQANIAKLKEERRVLNQQESSVQAITDKLNIMRQRLNATSMKSGEFDKIAKEVERLTKKLDETRKKIAELTGQSTSGSSTQARNARKVNEEYTKQLGYVDRLIRRMAVYGSISMIGGFLTKVREVTAQFELQRVSLGAILQDQNKANQLFSEIKSFALKSPVSILDLTKYTKQLAAYKIGYDELFETTKKLTDVSVGLGVSMDRVVLAYGQVRATGHLRASEIRQFTEMGVPIVEELATKISKMNGELVTAADVMDMVSKRAISFELVKEVFDDMTSAGGAFYNMQEKQGNTLYGLWAKLGDAASVMYEQIGNTGPVNWAMKTIISLLTTIMKNWRFMSGEIAALASGFMVYKTIQGLVTINTIAAAQATRDLARAQTQLNAAQKSSIWGAQASAKYAIAAAKANRIAANAVNIRTAAKYRLIGAMNKLKAAFMGNWIALAATAFFAIGAAIVAAVEKANRLNNTLAEIKSETSVLQAQSVRNFEYLANAAVKAADGSKQQKNALDELSRTYKDILPEEALKIENLRAMKGDYKELTQAIRENIAAQQESKALEAVKEEYSQKIIKAQRDAEESLLKSGFGDTEIQRFFRNIEKHYKELSDRLRSGEKIDIMGEIFNMSGIDKSKLSDKQLMKVAVAYTKIINAQEAWIQKENAIRDSYKDQTAYLGAYTKSMQNYNDWVERNMNSGETMLQNQQNTNMRIKGMESMIRQAMKNAGLAWNEEWANIVKSVNPNELGKISTLNMEAIVSAIDPKKYPDLRAFVEEFQKTYNGLVPSSPTVQQIQGKFFSVVLSVGASIQQMRQYLWDGSGSVDDYLKRLKEQQEQLTALLKEKEQTLVNWSLIDFFITGKTKEQIAAEIEETKKQLQVLNTLIPFVADYTVPKKDKNKGGTKSDTRLQELQEMYSTLKAINKEYDDLSKKEGKSKAGSWVVENYEATLKRLNDLAKKFNLSFDFPLTPDSLQKYGKQIIDKIKSLNLKGGDKAVIDLQLELAKDTQARLEKQIEQQLKDLQEKISRTKTAKEFYEKILSTTGDHSLASKVAESIFGQNGSTLQKALADQVRGMTNKIELPEGIISADNIIDYKALRQFAEANKKELGKMYDELVKISDDGQKNLAKTYEGYLKDLEKAKTYSDKRIELARYTANQIAEIEQSSLPSDEKSRLSAGYKERENKEAAKLEWEAFKNMPMYVQMFADLDHASTATLENMKRRLSDMQGAWKNLDPMQLKEMQSRLDEIDNQLTRRNPFKTLAESIKEYRDLRAAHGSESSLDKEIETATEAYIKAKKDLASQLAVNPDDMAAVANLQKRVNLSEEELKQLQKIADAYRRVKDIIGLSLGEVFQITRSLGDLAGGVGKLTEVFGGDEEDVQYWNDIANALNDVTSGIENMVQAALSGNPVKMITSAVTAIPNLISGFAGLFSAGKVRKANKEIKRQQNLLDQLDYTYGRLEKASDKVFGREYLNNYNQQLKNLQAQQTAYLKQAEAERSKGKKKDKEKIKEYEEQARETADKIKELQEELVAHFTGQNRADAARQMAQSWIEARASMSDTFAAIKGDYQDLIKNMIVEWAAARVIENALSPVWDSMEKMLAKNDVDGAIDSLINGMDAALTQANNGMEVLWKALEARGYDMKQLVGDVDTNYTGIAKTVSGVTSEEINAVAAIGNTLMYYVSPIPRIDENLAAIRAIMERGGSASSAVAGSAVSVKDYTDMFTVANQHLSSLPKMERHLSEIHNILGKIVSTRNGRHGVNSFLYGN